MYYNNLLKNSSEMEILFEKNKKQEALTSCFHKHIKKNTYLLFEALVAASTRLPKDFTDMIQRIQIKRNIPNKYGTI